MSRSSGVIGAGYLRPGDPSWTRRPACPRLRDMTRLLHISASPRGGASRSLHIADTFLEAYRHAHPTDEIETWDLWDGTLPDFGPAAAGAKMTVFAGATPEGEQAAAWERAREAFARFDSAD